VEFAVKRTCRKPFALLSIFAVSLITALLAARARGATPEATGPWSFGVMSDTQWTGVADDGHNPNSVAVDIIQQVNQKFVNAGVKFVIAVGDVTERGTTAALDTRAVFAQRLYNAGVGFYPLRGNHESTAAAATEFQRIFPQTHNGSNNSAPDDIYKVVNADSATEPTPAKAGSPFTVGKDFSSPSANLAGLSYSFAYGNATFILLDQFTPPDGKAADGSPYNVSSSAIASQQDWISQILHDRAAATHAFVFGHKGLITEHHPDTLLGASPNSNPAAYDTFMGALQAGGVRYYIGGHDHMHNRSIVTSPDGKSAVQEIVCASDSSKFYGPSKTPNDTLNREKLISQQLGTIGYYIYTVDGPRVTVDYYATGQMALFPPAGGESTLDRTSGLIFSRRETFGYDAINGLEFHIAQGVAYTSVLAEVKPGVSSYGETFRGTSGRIIGGTNGSSSRGAYDNRPFIKAVNTGWAPAPSTRQKSDVLYLWGMNTVSDSTRDTFVVSMSYDASAASGLNLAAGALRLMSIEPAGSWIDAVDANAGGTRRFVLGAWNSNYGLGTYGVDPATATAWAVVDHGGAFAVAGE